MPYITIYCLGALIISTIIPSIAECPRSCECKWKSGKESVLCLNTNLTLVPLHLESGTQILDLTGNSISSLRQEEFSKAGLVNLQKIFLAKCRLKSIERYAFKDLIILVELDLSYNLLNAVPSHSFDSIAELRELKLNGNPIQKISNNAFLNTPQLIRLEMSSCRITMIEPKAFAGLEETLEWLRLDENKFWEVDASAFTLLKNLHGLELTGNPWNCSCKLRELRQWMLQQNVPYDIPPICHSPKRLYEKSWNHLELDEFACAPTILPSESRAKGVEGKNVTLSCSIDGIPKPNVKWLLRNKIIANISGVSYVYKKMYILNLKNKSSELTIHSAETQDAGVYTCFAENKAGRAEAVVTLSVTKNNGENKLSHKALFVSVLLGITFSFVFCVFIACLLSLRKKRILKWHVSECRREDNYEKIELKQKVCRNVNGGVSRDDSALVTITRKNGDYRVVPGTDTDHENDDEEESTLEITTPGTSNDRKWTTEGSVHQTSKPGEIEDTCRGSDESRDNISRTYNSTSGTYKSTLPELKFVSTTKSSGEGQETLNTIYTKNSVRQVPDVIGHSPFTKSASCRSQSENGSVNDINELFCTLPRKRDLARYKSSDSQSPLLPESRYGSECASSSESFARRMSVESQRYPITNLNRNKASKVSSGSLLNLTRDQAHIDQKSTPLLDVKSLENRLSPQNPLQTQAVSQSPANPYGYHAAQLERFLEEYRMLQQQLTKMKETCDSICQEKMRDSSSPCTASNSEQSGILNNQISSPSSSCNQIIQESIDFKNFENELTKYLMSRSSSTKNFTSGILHNN